jgi:peptide/nickel transport system permease protein
MARYVLSRTLQAIPILLIISAFTFFLIHILPGDLVVARLGASATPADVARLRKQLHLDEPLILQYLDWLRNLLAASPGTSLVSNLPVRTVLWERLPVTLELVSMATLIAVILGIPMGVYSALRPRTPTDYLVRCFAVLGQAVPNYWLGIIALTYMSIYLKWVPPTSYKSPLANPLHNLEQFALPALISGYGMAAALIRFTRASLVSILHEDHVRTARAKGLSGRTVVVRHIVRNGLIPIVTLTGIQFTTLVGGTVIIETVFSLPGVGSLTLQSIQNRDYVQIEFNVLVIGLIVVASNLVIDAMNVVLDPRART